MKKLLTLLLALAFVFCSVPAASAETAAMRDTDFFTPRAHTDLHYSDITYRHIDTAPILREIEALGALSADAANAAAFERRFAAVNEQVEKLSAMLTLLDIGTYADASDEANAAAYDLAVDEFLEVADAFNRLVRDTLSSPCANALAKQMSEQVQQEFLNYEDMTDTERELMRQNTALETEYQSRVVQPFTYRYNGADYSAENAIYAFLTGKIGLDAYNEITAGIARTQNQALGGIYLRMIPVRNALARENGYANYAEYAYAEVYDRDYTLNDVRAFESAVKQHLVPLASAMLPYYVNYMGVDESELPESTDCSGAGVFETLLPCFAALSDELYESANYLYTHGFYDLEPSRTKTGTAFTAMLSGYEAPFFFSNATGTWQDLTTAIHELGHANAAYWKSAAWNESSLSIDVAEVHSQALELLMLDAYDELFGSQADAARFNTVFKLIYSGIINGCLHDEFQQYAYSTPNVTLDQLNRKYRDLCDAYGLSGTEEAGDEMYGWTDIPHTFTSPMYYISYATSAAGAFAFWEEAQRDYYGAVDHYLRFTAQSNALGFRDSFLGVGISSPLSGGNVRDLASLIHRELMCVAPFRDVYMDDWYGESVLYVQQSGLMNGTSATAFSPDGLANREQAMTIIARMLDERTGEHAPLTIAEGVAWAVKNGVSDGLDPKGTLTREQFVTMLYRAIGSPKAGSAALDFPDAGSVAPWAYDAMRFCVSAEIVAGYGDGALHPGDALSRAQMATLMERFTLSPQVWYSLQKSRT